MPTTKNATDIDTFIDSIDPTTMRDGRHLRAIAAARADLSTVEAELRSPVAASREAGDFWTMIGIVLGVSRQNAHRKFGRGSFEAVPRDPAGHT